MLLLLSDDLVFNFVVLGLGNDLLPNQVILSPIWPPIDDLLRKGLTYTWQGIQSVFRSRIDVQLLGYRCGGLCGGRLGDYPGRLFLGRCPFHRPAPHRIETPQS
jgi:hypothetical protein